MSTLFNTLCSVSCLHTAWKLVKSKNSAGGIDGFSVFQFEADIKNHLDNLLGELESKTWNPEPYLRIEIPKNETEKRKLGLLSIKDKIVQQAIKNLIEPRFERQFLNNSYAYRPDKGHTKAIRRVMSEIVKKKNSWIVQLDIDDYFDTINHDILFNRIKSIIKEDEIIRLIELSVKMGIVSKQLKWTANSQGVPQGAVLSPLLANFYLHPFDQFVTSKTESYIRYADDFLIICENKGHAEDLFDKTSEFLKTRLLLRLNEPIICEKSQGVEFLGVFVNDKGIRISEEKKAKLRERIQSIEFHKGAFTAKSLETLNGIRHYYAKLLPQELLTPLDEILKEKVKSLISKEFIQFPNKTILQKALFPLPLFSQDAEINRKNQLEEWIAHYLQQKQSHAGKANSKSPEVKRLIESKKREYRKREGEGAELVVATIGCFIGKNNGGITVKTGGKLLNKAPTSTLEHITVISRGVSFSTDAVRYCCDNHIPIDFFDQSGKLYASILSPVFVEQSLWQKQALLSPGQKSYLASRIIEGKLKNQISLAKYYNKYHKEDFLLQAKYEYLETTMNHLLLKIKKNDFNNENYAEILMGYEAVGANAYWAYVRQLLQDDGVSFESRERKGATDLFNSLLNYGYALLYARVWQAILSVKLNPSIGILHACQAGKPTLVYDLVELFRSQTVDRVVISLIQKGEPLSMDKHLLNEQTKKLLLQNVFERMNRYEKYRGEETKFLHVFRLQAKELAQYVSGESKSYKPYLAKW